MSKIGKQIRIERIIHKKSKNMVIIPMDHGISDGPIKGLSNIAESINKVAEGKADAVLMHKGMVEHGYRGYGLDIGLIIHASVSTALGPDPNDKVQACTVKEAIQLGADAISLHVNIGSETESAQLQILGNVARDCDHYGIPLLSMMYPRGKNIKNPYDKDLVAHVVRIGAELGSDIIKTVYTGCMDSFKEVVDGCPIPIIVAGGPKTNTDRELLEMISNVMDAGARGVAIGRNVFQHKSPTKMTKAITKIVHEKQSIESALEVLVDEK